MKSRFTDRCSLCGSEWPPGELIERWLGKWAHATCKAARAASVASEGQRTELPTYERSPNRQQVTGKKLKSHRGYTRGIRKVM